MNIFNHFQHINLTDDQNNALGGIQAFIESDQQVFILQGYAGTGKTTILKGVRNFIIGKNQSCKLLAPTGRAAILLIWMIFFQIVKTIYYLFKNILQCSYSA